MKILFSIGSLLDRLFVVAGAFLGSQIPAFYQQYSQRLSGHAQELQQLLAQLTYSASLSHKTLDQYIQKFLANSDPDFAAQGAFMQNMVVRLDQLTRALMHFKESSAWMRPFVFLKELQYDIAGATFNTFQPALNISLEGFCYAGVGIVFGWACYQLLSKSLVYLFARTAKIFKTI